jgi:hypothetical protein
MQHKNIFLKSQASPAALSELESFVKQLDKILADAGVVPYTGPSAPSEPRPLTLAERVLAERKIASIYEPSKLAPPRARRGFRRADERGCLVRGTGHSPSTPLHASTSTTSPYTLTFAEMLRRPTLWRTASADDKLLHAIRVVHAGDGFAFNINLSTAEQRAIVESANPVRTFARRVQRAFQSLGLAAPPFAFQIETSPSGRTHVHGAVLHRPLSRDRLVEALMLAGGKMHGKTASTQVRLRTLFYAPGWLGYMQLDSAWTREVLGKDRLSFISQDLLRLTREAWGGGEIVAKHK